MTLAAGLRLPLVLVIDTAGPGAVGGGRRRRAGRRDRPLSGRAGHAGHPDGVGAARPGQRRAGAGDGAGRPGAGRAARLARPAAAGGRQRDRLPRHRARRRNCPPHKASDRPTCWRRASSTSSCRSIRTPPTSRKSSACGCRRRSPSSCMRYALCPLPTGGRPGCAATARSALSDPPQGRATLNLLRRHAGSSRSGLSLDEFSRRQTPADRDNAESSARPSRRSRPGSS